MSKKIKLTPCVTCGRYPKLLKVQDEYKYMCSIQCDSEDNKYLCTAGYWHTTKRGARRAWNERMKGVYA